MILIVTPLAAAALTILYVRLALNVISIRKRENISLGSAGNDSLEKTCRAHANLTEWAPIGLILIAILEINGAPFWLCLIPAITFIAGHTLHPRGLTGDGPTALKQRVQGMQLTIFSTIALSAINLFWMFYRFVSG